MALFEAGSPADAWVRAVVLGAWQAVGATGALR